MEPKRTMPDTRLVAGKSGVSHLLRQGAAVEILECDKTGHVQQAWIHFANGSVEAV